MFDTQVNEALAKGYVLGRRGPEMTGAGEYALYAEMFLLDPPAEPEPFEPFQALSKVQELCRAHQGTCGECRLFKWCLQLEAGGDPDDWELPEVDA
jgi:hypothetical protein